MKTALKYLAVFLSLLLASVTLATAQVTTTVSDQPFGPNATGVNGSIIITANSTFNAADGTLVLKGTSTTASIVAGSFSVALIPNSGSNPSGTSYTAAYQLPGGFSMTETWVVPVSVSPVNLLAVRTSPPPTPAIMFAMSQLNPPPGCLTNQTLLWNGTNWTCVTASGSGTVTSFAAPSGSWPSWLVPTITNPTTTPSLAAAASAIPNSALADSAKTDLSNLSGTTAVNDAAITFSGAAGLTAGGTGQSVTIKPSGTIESASIGSNSGHNDIFLNLGGTQIWDNVQANYTGITALNNEILTLNGTQFRLAGGTSNAHQLQLGNTISDTAQSIKATDELELLGSSLLLSPSVGGLTMPAPTLNNLTGSIQCLHVDASGLVSGTGIDCGAGVSSVTGDGVLIINSASTGAVTLALGAASAHSFFGNNTGSTGTPAYHQPAFTDLSGSLTLAQTPLTSLGDLLYANATPALARLAGNTTSTLNVLTQTGNGTISAAPAWNSLAGISVPVQSGTITTGDCVKWASGTSITDAGAACGSGSGGVSSITGDGTLITNSSSTGAVTLTLGNAAAHSFFGNNTGSTGAPAYHQPAFTDLSGSLASGQLPSGWNPVTNANLANSATTVNGATCTLGSSCNPVPLTTLGDILYENSSPALARLAGQTTTTKEYLSQTGNGTISAAPAWAQVAYADLSGTPQLPNTIAQTSHKWLDSYTSSTGNFTASQPNFTDLLGSLGLAQTPLTTQGDLLYANATPALARLPIGTSGQCLTSNGTTVAWGACASGSGVTLETNGSNNSSQTTLNLKSSAATNGVTLTETNTSGGDVQLGLSGTLTVPGGGTGLGTLVAHELYVGNGTSNPNPVSTGTAGQVLISNGSGSDPTFQDPVVSSAYMNLFNAAGATTTQTSSAVRNPVFSQSGTFIVTFASIAGSPSGCTLQVKAVDSLGNSLNDGSAISVTAANGTTSDAFVASVNTAAQMSLVYACTSYPSAGTITVDFAPQQSTVVSNFPATQPISGTVTANAGTGTFTVGGTVTSNIGTTGGLALDSTLTGGTLKAEPYDGTNVIGTSTHPVQVSLANTASNSTAVKVDGSGVTQPVSGTVTSNVGTTGGLALDATLTGGTLKAEPYDGTNIIGTSTHPVQVSLANTASNGTAVKVDGSAVTQPISAAALPLPSGASTETTLAKLPIAQSTALGTNSGPLMQASVTTGSPTYTTGNINPLSLTTAGALRVDGSATTQPVSGTVTANAGTGTFSVSGTVTSNIGTTNGLALDATLTGGTLKAEPYDGTNVIGTSTHPVRTDPTGTTTQPVSGTVTANAGTGSFTVAQATAANLQATVTGTVTANAGTGTMSVNQAQVGGTAVVADPCRANTKSYVSISQTANTQLVTGTSGKKIYICSIHVVTVTAQDVALVEGTGSTCGSGTAGVQGFGGSTAATGWNFAANGGIAYGNGGYSLGAEGTATDNLCLFNSGSGQVSGGLSYVVQ